MKLYYTPGACSLSPHIVLRELGAAFDLERVDTATGRTQSGEDYAAVNPMGYVPALRLDDGAVLTEGAAIVQYLADTRPSAGLAPPVGSLPRARMQAYLNFIASELHKAFGPFFNPTASDGDKAAAGAQVHRRFDHIERELADGRTFLLGDAFSVADAYLFVVSNWAAPSGIALDRWPLLTALVTRIRSRPAVAAALAAEGLT